MLEQPDRESAAALARLTESWLGLGAKLELPGMALTLLALAVLLLNEVSLPILTGLTCAVMLGILGKYYALRVALDRRLFLHWAERWESNAANPGADMARLDTALSASGLRDSPPEMLRSLQCRQRGAFGLFRNQVIVFLLQCFALLMSGMATHWGR